MSEKKTISRDERLFNIGWDAALEFTEASREQRELAIIKFTKSCHEVMADSVILARFKDDQGD